MFGINIWRKKTMKEDIQMKATRDANKRFNNNAAFDIPGVGPVFAGATEDAYYYGISLGGIMGLYFSGLTPDIERFGVDVPAIEPYVDPGTGWDKDF